nr:DUF4166 domain-containing protein [Frondihabitans sp. 762G35]
MRLRAYFAAIPEGSVGRGEGVFDVVGTPRLWLWPVLFVLGRLGIAFPAWEHGVPFRVENRPAATGRPAVDAVRTFSFPRGERRMVDAIAAEPGGLVDHLGGRRLLVAELAAEVRDRRLLLTGRGLRIRLGGRSLRVPAAVAPGVALVERFDDERDRQHVSVTLTLPVIGTIYQYSGYFEYAVEPFGAAHTEGTPS